MATRLNRTVASRWEGAILVCGKCSKKLGGGFGAKGKQSLAKALRSVLGLGKGRKATLGIVETRCLGVCPRGAVCVVDSRRPAEWLLVGAGEDPSAVAARLAPAASRQAA